MREVKVDLTDLHFPGAPLVRGGLPGPKAKELLAAQQGLESNVFKYSRAIPLVPKEARGATIKDVDGNIFLDFFAGIGVLNFGHSNPHILAAAQAQEERLIHSLDFPAPPRVELMRKLNELAPGEMRGHAKVMFGGPSGSDAVEGAIKLAKRCTGRLALLAFSGSYHGQTAGALTLSSGRSYRERHLPLLPEVHFAPYPYCYRCPFKQVPQSCGLLCLNYLAELLRDPYSGLAKPAGIIVEPIQGEGGVVVPPDSFLGELRRLTAEEEIPLIVDEIQTGFGRTGRVFACEHSGITPDFITLGKALGGVGYPLSGVLYHERWDTIEPGEHMGTFRGHLVAMAAGAAGLDFLLENELPGHAARLGELLLAELRQLQEEVPQIGEVRGKGLFIGVELVKDRKTKEPYPELVRAVQRRCFEKGLLIWSAGRYGNVIRLMPPLVITEELALKGVEILSSVIRDLVKSSITF
jgi:diaminobutyrate-2-oxoglutarate transaminase